MDDMSVRLDSGRNSIRDLARLMDEIHTRTGIARDEMSWSIDDDIIPEPRATVDFIVDDIEKTLPLLEGLKDLEWDGPAPVLPQNEEAEE